MFVRRLITAILFNVVVFGGMLFSLAGTIHWWRGWVFLVVTAVAMTLIMVTVLRPRPELMRERFKGVFQRGQPRSDRVIMLLFLIGYSATIVFAPLDVFRYHLLPKPGLVVSSLGLAMVVAGYWIFAVVLRENAFAVPVVRHQVERQHVVIDTGVYSVVRHPMYVGVILLVVGMPWWLESYAAALLGIFPSAMLIVRICFEERFLSRELSGYSEYLQRVRYRLVPYVW